MVSLFQMKLTIQDSDKLIPMALAKFGKCFDLTCHEEVMPYNVYTYETVSMGAASILSALDVLKDADQQPFLDNLEKWDCMLGNGMKRTTAGGSVGSKDSTSSNMFDLIKYSSIYCKMDCKVLMEGYEYLEA